MIFTFCFQCSNPYEFLYRLEFILFLFGRELWLPWQHILGRTPYLGLILPSKRSIYIPNMEGLPQNNVLEKTIISYVKNHLRANFGQFSHLKSL